MAQITQVTLVDDLDGESIEAGSGETVTFTHQGKSYEIDLSTKNAQVFAELLEPYIAAGRSVSARTTARTGGAARTKTAAGNPETAKIREWAKENGHEVKDRGRIHATVVDAYRAAND